MLVVFILINWVISLLPLLDVKYNDGRLFKVDNLIELVEAVLWLSVPILNLVLLSNVFGTYFKEKSK